MKKSKNCGCDNERYIELGKFPRAVLKTAGKNDSITKKGRAE